MTGSGAAGATEVLRTRHRDRIEVRRFRLLVTAGPDAGKEFELRPATGALSARSPARSR